MKQTKKELLNELKELLTSKGMYSIDGIGVNSSKGEIINAINCLKCDDEELITCLEIVKIIYPNIYQVVTNEELDFTSFKTHSFNRLYIYNLAN